MIKRSLFFVIAALALVASCAKEPDFQMPDSTRIPMNIDGSINQVPTKATAQGFVDKDAVGLFAVNYSENNTVAGTLLASGNQADNVKYIFDESAQKWTPVKSVYYKDVNTHVDIYLYYPYQQGISDVDASGFEVQKDQSAAATAASLSGYEASDWLWGKATDITPTEAKVRVQLAHRLSAVQVNLVEGNGFDAGEFESLSKSVILTNTTRKATLNFATGEATALGQPQLDGIVMCPQTDGGFRAIVIPQSVAAGTQLFAITLDGVSYSFKQGQAVTYQAGKQMNVDITLNKKTPSGDYELVLSGTTIVDWREDLNTHGGEARQYFVVNVETPGTLGETITAMGKNPAKIKNLKVVGNVNKYDFYYMRDQMTILEAINMKEAKIKSTGDEIEHADKTWAHYESYYVTQYGEPDYVDGNWCIWYEKDDYIPNDAFHDKKSLVYFVFPEVVSGIGDYAFAGTTLSGPLILPEQVKYIRQYAFWGTSITTIQFPINLESIGDNAFYECRSTTGSLILPDKIKVIPYACFMYCGFNGRLQLPQELEHIEAQSFYIAGTFVGDLTIPEKVKSIGDRSFYNSIIAGSLTLSNVAVIGEYAFIGCAINGELVIPEGLIEIREGTFMFNNFSSVIFPSTLRTIGSNSFYGNNRLCEPLVFPEGLITIGAGAFVDCSTILGLYLPSTLQTIGANAFCNCFYISSIVCDAIESPNVGAGAFDGVAKGNFTVEVPPQSVKRYQAESGWNDFLRIEAHYDFSLSRRYMRALNAAQSRTYFLRAPANYGWSVDEVSLPDWITVSPMSGIGKTDVTISITDMPRTDDTFEVNEGSFNNPDFKNYKGRQAEIVFRLDEKDYTFTFNVEQYDYDYPDGYVQTLQTATQGPGIDFVFTGDGYDARDIAKGTFADNAAEGFEHLFDIEPYKTYKNYFNVYAVTAMSDDSGIGTVNTIKESKFGGNFINADDVFLWAKKADASMDLSRSLVILLDNTSAYYGVTYMWGDGSALSVCPVSREAYPYDYRGLIQHEAGGHGFGKLADEYIYHNAFITHCGCPCCDHPQHEYDMMSAYGRNKALGWYKNISMISDTKQVPWSHLMFHPQYSDYVDIFEGAYMHTRGMYRSEITSCMNNNIPYYSAISRQAIVERIKEYAGETFSLEEFYALDDDSFGTITKAAPHVKVDRTFGVDPLFYHGEDHGPIYMGEHPNVQ